MNVIIILFTITLLCFVLALVSSVCEWKRMTNVFVIAGGCLFGVFAIVGVISCVYFNSPKYPTALDVYRGKTTLEITYRDSVAVDSIVVYKMK